MIDKETQIRDLLQECVKLGITVSFLSLVGAPPYADTPHVAIPTRESDEGVIAKLTEAIEQRKNQLKNIDRLIFYELISKEKRLSDEG